MDVRSCHLGLENTIWLCNHVKLLVLVYALLCLLESVFNSGPPSPSLLAYSSTHSTTTLFILYTIRPGEKDE